MKPFEVLFEVIGDVFSDGGLLYLTSMVMLIAVQFNNKFQFSSDPLWLVAYE